MALAYDPNQTFFRGNFIYRCIFFPQFYFVDVASPGFSSNYSVNLPPEI